MVVGVMDAPTRELPSVNGHRRGLPLDRIDQTAAEVDFARGTRRVVAALVYYPARFVGSLVSGAAWMVAAWKVGYQDGRRRRPREAAQ